jgi:lipoprotein-anchoring transpeptidase ErfK/SrfK
VATACGPAATPEVAWVTGAPPKPAATLSFNIDNAAANLSPTAPISVSVTNGTLVTVALTDAAGKAAQGVFDDSQEAWRVTEPLAEGQSYTLAVTGMGEDGKQVQETRTFTTVQPDNHTYVTFTKFWSDEMQNGDVYGVGQPIRAHFDEAIPQGGRAAAEKALVVTTDPPTVGSWYWFDDQNVHWRPQNYWTPGTKVTVQANTYGASFGVQSGNRTLYGDKNNSVSFTIGDSKIAKIDNNTHQMSVFINGTQITNMNGHVLPNGTVPVSMGQNGLYTIDHNWIDLRTHSGVHLVMDKANPVEMSPAGIPKNDPNYYKVKVPEAVRISSGGEYVHWADWSVSDQGIRNVSHGCVNINPIYADWFYPNFNTGDVVEIYNTGIQLDPQDGNGDWQIPWADWLKGSAVQQ